ncbi:hypothetical protein [Marinoscillum pacificum]|uniref:hypothetical protein n=1 Tax=Marinoscillum pacificum TaxID=392723 RepID=UPI00215849E8|nr:hypothetical protein [Marinoscillum pacificum]
MAGSGGLVHDMVKTTNNNRSLLKKASGTYGSFDHASYALPKNSKTPAFKEASPEILADIQEKMNLQNAETARKKRIIIIAATTAAIICMAIMLLVKF